MNAAEKPAAGLLVSGDLFFSSKITGTAGQLGIRIELCSALSQAKQNAASGAYRFVLLDLGLPGLDVEELLASLPSGQRPKVVAFGPHVHTARLDEARRAGCDDVLPRSRFSAELPRIVQQLAAG